MGRGAKRRTVDAPTTRTGDPVAEGSRGGRLELQWGGCSGERRRTGRGTGGWCSAGRGERGRGCPPAVPGDGRYMRSRYELGDVGHVPPDVPGPRGDVISPHGSPFPSLAGGPDVEIAVETIALKPSRRPDRGSSAIIGDPEGLQEALLAYPGPRNCRDSLWKAGGWLPGQTGAWTGGGRPPGGAAGGLWRARTAT